jgi:hypothetical protein
MNTESKNPFVQSPDFKIRVKKKITKQFVFSYGELQKPEKTSYSTIESVQLIETQSKSSVYQFPYDNNVIFKELTSSGRDLFLYLVYNLRPNQDWIRLPQEFVCTRMNISPPTFYKAIANLTDNAIIVKKKKGEYWINPYFLFSGNRVTYYQDKNDSMIDIVVTQHAK